MKKEEKTQLTITLVIITIIVVCFSVLVWAIINDAKSDRSLAIDGTIINVEHIGESEYYIYGEVFEITFDTDDIVIVESRSYDNDLLDLTIGQHIIIHLWKDEPDDNWDIRQIVVIENPIQNGGQG